MQNGTSSQIQLLTVGFNFELFRQVPETADPETKHIEARSVFDFVDVYRV